MKDDLRFDDLYNALDHIRYIASIHFLGDAFEPEHMREIANFAIDVLNGDATDIKPLPTREEIEAAILAEEDKFRDIFE